MKSGIKAFFHEPTYTVTYVVSDPATQKCVIIDSVLDFDAKSGRTSTRSADEVISYIGESGLAVEWIFETHIHADHLTAAPYLKEKLGGLTCVGRNVPAVQKVFKGVFNVQENMPVDGSQFDRLLADGDVLECGELKIEVLATPGHTPACVSLVIGDAVFIGDTMFMPDFGTARCDFPGGDATALYRSIHRILSMPDATRLFLCHDYAPGDRDYMWETTVAEQRKSNIHVKDGIDEASFVAMRTARDEGLEMPALILPSVQVNMTAGNFPEPEDNGVSYLKLPLNAL